MSVFHKLVDANHEIVLVVPMGLGIATYVCERCGALIKLRDDKVILFHVPPVNSTSREDQCYPGDPLGPDQAPLRGKLDKLYAEEMERFHD